MALGVRLAGLRGDERSCKSALFTLCVDGASELISVCLRLKYDPLSDWRNCCPIDMRMEVMLVEESVWVVE